MTQDLYIQVVDPKEQTPRALFTFGLQPSVVEGIRKLVARWLLIFMTPKGSHPLRKTEGTIFPRLLGGNVADLPSVEADILESIEDATDQLRASDRQNSTRPSSERIKTAALVQFVELPPSGVEFWVEITSMSGERMALPIPYAMT